MAKATGRVTVKVDGEILLTKSGWTLNVGGVSRTNIPHDTGDVLYSEATVAARAAGNITHTEALDLVALVSITGATILVETDSGQSYVIRGGWLVGPPELTAGEGETAIAFEGPPAEKI